VSEFTERRYIGTTRRYPGRKEDLRDGEGKVRDGFAIGSPAIEEADGP